MTQILDPNRELWNPAVQAMDPDALATHQRAALAKQWKRIWEQPIPFYKNKFEAAGFNAKEVPPLDDIPRTIKDELRADDAANPPWGTWRAMTLDEATCIGASTGTTGKPMVYLRGLDDFAIMQEVMRRNVWRQGLRPRGRMTQSWPGGIYAAMGGWVNALSALPAMEIPLGPPMSVDVAKEQINTWILMKPTNFMLSGSQLQIYAQAADELGVDLREVFNGGNVAFMEASCQYDGPRQNLEDRFNFKIYNISGASELVGGAVTDCRYHTGFHTHADFAIAQVCDPVTGKEVPAGGRGMLVWTALAGNSFWLRYDVEDWVERMVGTCPCGDTGPRYRLLGRSGDLQMLNGKQIFPLDVQLALDDLGAPEFVVEKGKKPDTLCVKVETADDGSRHVAALEKALGVKAEVTPIPVGSLPRAFFKQKRS
jgi:phenylacetate-CoA ligase